MDRQRAQIEIENCLLEFFEGTSFFFDTAEIHSLKRFFHENFSHSSRLDADSKASSLAVRSHNRSRAFAQRRARALRVTRFRVIGLIRPTFQFAAPRTKLLASTRIQVSTCEYSRSYDTSTFSVLNEKTL